MKNNADLFGANARKGVTLAISWLEAALRVWMVVDDNGWRRANVITRGLRRCREPAAPPAWATAGDISSAAWTSYVDGGRRGTLPDVNSLAGLRCWRCAKKKKKKKNRLPRHAPSSKKFFIHGSCNALLPCARRPARLSAGEHSVLVWWNVLRYSLVGSARAFLRRRLALYLRYCARREGAFNACGACYRTNAVRRYSVVEKHFHLTVRASLYCLTCWWT